MDNQILESAKEWANNPYFDEADREEIQTLLDKGDEKELADRFYKDIEFGTGGLRSILGMGKNRMNKYAVRRATQAVANVIRRIFQGDLSACISYDSRTFSDFFAKEAASVFAANGIKVFIYDHLTPVPLLSYATRYTKSKCGVMITASHNPKMYNGYKLYWEDGAQVTPPNDNIVIEEYAKVSDYNSIKYLDFHEGLNKGFIEWIGSEVENNYFKLLNSKTVNSQLCKERGGEVGIVFTPIHGTGLVHCTRILEMMGLTNVHVVKEQAEPDNTFPTVEVPNPELPETLDMAIQLMEKVNADIAMGTDPDTDRVGIVVRHKGENVILNGNQLGILYLHYILENLSKQNKLPENPLFIKTIVTTELQKTIADHYHVKTENTLTGFKWMGARMREIELNNENLNFVFGTEESFGYLPHTEVRDKDGVASIAGFSELALWYKTQGKTLVDGLEDIYEKFGFSGESLLCLNYLGKEGAEKIVRIMDEFRKAPPLELAGEKITLIEDYKNKTTKNLITNEEGKTTLPSSNVIGYSFGDGNKLYLRPSGTEPKIKFYTMIQVKEGSLASKKEIAHSQIQAIENYIKDRCEKI